MKKQPFSIVSYFPAREDHPQFVYRRFRVFSVSDFSESQRASFYSNE